MPLLPFIKNEFKLSYTQSSFVTSAFALSNGTGQLPAGYLADRIGPRILILVGIVGVAAGGVLVGISQTYIMLIVFLVVMGLLAGGYHPASTPMLSASVEPNQRGRVLGFHLIGGNAGLAISPLIATAIAAAWDWRSSFLLLAIPTAVFGLIFYFYLGRQTVKSRTEAAKTGQGEEKPPPPGNMRRLIAFLTMSVLGGGAGMSVMTFLSLYAHNELGASEQAAGSLLSVTFTAGIITSPLGGYISDRIGRVPIIIATSLLSGILVYVVQFTPWGIAFGAVLLFMGVNNAFRMPASEAYIMAQTTARHRSTIYGVYYFAMQYTGAIFAPIMGQLIDRWGFDVCFNISSATVVVVTLICSAFLRGGRD